jgi:hypothetical protein
MEESSFSDSCTRYSHCKSLASSVDAGKARCGAASIGPGNARGGAVAIGNAFDFGSVALFDATFGMGADTLEMGAVLTLAVVEACSGLKEAFAVAEIVADLGRGFLTGGLRGIVAVVLSDVAVTGAPAAK